MANKPIELYVYDVKQDKYEYKFTTEDSATLGEAKERLARILKIPVEHVMAKYRVRP